MIPIRLILALVAMEPAIAFVLCITIVQAGGKVAAHLALMVAGQAPLAPLFGTVAKRDI